MDGQYTTEVEARIQHDLGPRLPAEAIELGLNQLVSKPERENDLIDTGSFQQTQMPFEQALATELQQALRQLLVFGLLQTQTAPRCENDGTHESFYPLAAAQAKRRRRRPLSDRCRYSRPGTPSRISRVRFASDNANAVSGGKPANGASSR